MIDLITSISLWDLVKHAKAWIVNLKRAKNNRKEQSKEALRKVIIASRKTRVYIRQLRDNNTRDHGKEAELTQLWTELGYILEDLNVTKLSKKCQDKGSYWADPGVLNIYNLEKSEKGLKIIEQVAADILN